MVTTEDGKEPTQACVINAVGMVSKNLHFPVKDEHQKLTEKLRGHYGYCGIIWKLLQPPGISGGSAKDLATLVSRWCLDGDVTWAQFLRLETLVESSSRPSGARPAEQRSEVMR